MEVLLDIIKVTIPALIVFLTVYYLQRSFYKNELARMRIRYRNDREDPILEQKIKAYERLSLLCERIRIEQLVIRLKSSDSTKKDLKMSMLIAIQQEIDHNVAQQIYVSHDLWDIVQLAANQTRSIIKNTADEIHSDDANEYIDAMLRKISELDFNPLDRALYAIREEVRAIS